MTTIRLQTQIEAPVLRCFDLARDIDAHQRSVANTGERAVAGVTGGLIGMGQSVTWEARHFGIRQRMTVKVTEFESPNRFADEMTSGPFKSMRHVHEFAAVGVGTVMMDEFTFTAPFGWLGRLVEVFVLERYMRRFLSDRAQELKAMAESDP